MPPKTSTTIQQPINNHIVKYNFTYGFGIAGGVLTGVIAGVLINVCIQSWFSHKRKNNIIKNIKFELEYNIKHTERIISKINEMINSCNSDNLLMAFKPLNISHKINSALSVAYKNGILYEIMPSNSIADIMEFLDWFSDDSSKLYNRLIFNAIEGNDKTEIVKQLIFIREEVNNHNRKITSACSSIY